ncbi:AMP-dependent synthetase [Actinomadura sp. KC06]|uniref:AMP-binding protein n=1 Tax=Actinomadura sp. KC06 TaxID=2530369 RepID=UPI001051C6F5|nr:AMP-binding protein [Actinomadura sp. KC06]TDD30909.1 AMP-dependent synthetase [Actinomadura sp. KC06]
MSVNTAPARVRSSVDNLYGFMMEGADADPGAPAVVEAGAPGGEPGVVTYGELRERVEEYAGVLGGLGLDVGDRVILESDTSSSAIAAYLACCLLGLPFVPVSPETPAKRLLAIIESARPALFLQAEAGVRDGIPPDVGTARFGPDGLRAERPPVPRPRRRREVVATDPAYIIFTSGTTGRPKGVVMSHRAITAFFRAVRRLGLVRPGDRVATTSPLQFDFALFDIGIALGSGATVVPVPRARLRWPRRFLGVLRDTGATHVHGVPSIWRPALRNEPELLGSLGLRGVLFCGEHFPMHELRLLQALSPGTRLVNCYGATESMACSFTDVPAPIPDDLELLSIGFAHPGAEMMIADERGRPIEATGVPGEIYLRSPALFSGYWDDPEATAAALVPDPLNPLSGQVVFRTGDLAHRGPDGELYFRARADSQVQIRGNRVEVAEVERRLAEFPGVGAACAMVLPGDGAGADPVLCAFVAAPPGLDRMAARSFCAEALPDYMVPQELHIVVGDLPLTENGKVDRTRLAAMR